MNTLLFKVIIILPYFLFSTIQGDRYCGPLFLTVTADTNTKIIMNWQFTCTDHPDTVILCATSYTNECREVLTKVTSIASRTGDHKTEISFGYKENFPGGWNKNDKHPIRGTHCFPYYIISLRQGEKVDENCLSIEPTWMEKFGKLKLGLMMIPGTHNSGAYKKILVVVRNYVLNQDRSLWAQLVSGIRFLDIRVGYYERTPERFWINHDFVRIIPLEPELQSILNFLKKTRKEIVILNIHRFPTEFTNDHHYQLVDLLAKLFSKYIFTYKYPEDSKLKLEQIWKTGKRLIISYNDEQTSTAHDWLSNQIARKWGDTHTIDDTYKYLRSVVHSRASTSLYVLMAEPTPNLMTFVKYSSLRKLTDIFNPQLNFWLRDEKWDELVNIIAVDFFMTSDIVNIAIEANYKHLKNVTNRNNYVRFVKKKQLKF